MTTIINGDLALALAIGQWLALIAGVSFVGALLAEALAPKTGRGPRRR